MWDIFKKSKSMQPDVAATPIVVEAPQPLPEVIKLEEPKMFGDKVWAGEPFWGLGFEWDPQWVLTPAQKELQGKLIELCQTTLRENAVESDRKLLFPRKNFKALTSLGLLGLIVPKELGGLGENHVCTAMVVETIARYGCASTAMCYTMHIGAVAAALFRHHDSAPLKDILSRLDRDCLIGTLSYSDPETGGHFWYPMSSGAERVPEGWKVRKKASWTTSGGFADWYIVQTTSPDFNGNFSNLSCFLILNDEVHYDPSQWDGLGLRGNQSGALEVRDRVIPLDRIVGPVGDGAPSNDETVDPYFLLCSSSCWNGISLGLIDIAKAHTTRKTHKDVGLRVADYPTIQDYVGEAIIDTNASRSLVFLMAQALDGVTNNNDWSIHQDLTALPRAQVLHWMWQVKFTAAKNVAHVSDKMLHACGGTAYKPQLGIERYLRDGKAGWVMGPSNEILRQFVGKASLLGFPSLDYWNTSINERAIQNETKKMSAEQKRALAERLMAESEPQKVAAE
ncbi:MAG: acyl-CoA dehydrogenase family protein [Hyphomicrobiales bacterium]|nr:acyl-CoA dehydrogenase family protein [Hyphomicrobiales bacterium]